MTKQEIIHYIESKQIPISFEKVNVVHYLRIGNTEVLTSLRPNAGFSYTFPLFDIGISKIFIDYVNIRGTICFDVKKDTLEQCLGEFFFWLEVNKVYLKNIKYYEKGTN